MARDETSKNTRKDAAIDVGDGRTAVRIEWRRRGDDLYVHISGGSDHIGAAVLVSAAAGEDVCSNVLRVPPHREHDLALGAATALHKRLGVTVCVTAGIHVDNITHEEITAVLRNVDQAVGELARLLDV